MKTSSGNEIVISIALNFLAGCYEKGDTANCLRWSFVILDRAQHIRDKDKDVKKAEQMAACYTAGVFLASLVRGDGRP